MPNLLLAQAAPNQIPAAAGSRLQQVVANDSEPSMQRRTVSAPVSRVSPFGSLTYSGSLLSDRPTRSSGPIPAGLPGVGAPGTQLAAARAHSQAAARPQPQLHRAMGLGHTGSGKPTVAEQAYATALNHANQAKAQSVARAQNHENALAEAQAAAEEVNKAVQAIAVADSMLQLFDASAQTSSEDLQILSATAHTTKATALQKQEQLAATAAIALQMEEIASTAAEEAEQAYQQAQAYVEVAKAKMEKAAQAPARTVAATSSQTSEAPQVMKPLAEPPAEPAAPKGSAQSPAQSAAPKGSAQPPAEPAAPKGSAQLAAQPAAPKGSAQFASQSPAQPAKLAAPTRVTRAAAAKANANAQLPSPGGASDLCGMANVSMTTS